MTVPVMGESGPSLVCEDVVVRLARTEAIGTGECHGSREKITKQGERYVRRSIHFFETLCSHTGLIYAPVFYRSDETVCGAWGL